MEKHIPCKQTSKESWSINKYSYKKKQILKTITKDKGGHYITIKGSIQEDTTNINIYAPNIGAPQYIKQMLTAIKGEINSNTIVVEDFNTQLTLTDRSSTQKCNKEHSF